MFVEVVNVLPLLLELLLNCEKPVCIVSIFCPVTAKARAWLSGSMLDTYLALSS